MLLAIAGVSGIAWIFDQPGKVILAALAVYVIWHLVNLLRLGSWIQNPERDPPRSLGVWADVFDRIRSMEAQAGEQEARYQALIDDFQNVTDAIPDATLIVDVNSTLAGFNHAAGTLLGLREKDDIGRPVSNLIRSTDLIDWLAARDQEKSSLEMAVPGNEPAWFDIVAVSIRGNQRLIILHDVSEVHNVERIKRDFVTNVSHELRTPLTVMRGYLELLLDRPSDETRDALQRMHTQAIQMQSMLDDLLELSRLQAVEANGEEENVDVPSMLMQLREQAEEISRGSHSLLFEVKSGLSLSGVKSSLESAFRNLIVNALKYTPAGGSVSISWHDSNEGPTLTVADTGIGISKREIPRLTERFYRVGSDRGRESGGTGLGLAIVKHVLNGHQARLVIESEYGVGSRFTCIFPPERRA
jgi:two-component system phosphate regulon sensor histidine kinase PhoR